LSAWKPNTVVAGNMGVSALEQLPSITPTTPVVIELSSWQLEGLAEYGLSPHIAVATNLSPDHLNRYATMVYGFQAVSIAAQRLVVVVFPFVPVTPMIGAGQ